MEWYKETELILDEVSGNTRVYVEPSSPTALPLFITHIIPEDEGVYVCRALTADGAIAREASVTLRVFEPVHFTDTPRRQRLVKGAEGPQKITCRARGSPEPDIKFERNGVALTMDAIEDDIIGGNGVVEGDGSGGGSGGGGKYRIVEDGLEVFDVDETDAGKYKCKAMVISTGQLKMMHIHVDVDVSPKIIGPEPITQVFAGGPATLHCQAEGTPAPSVSWYKDLSASLLTTGEKYQVYENGTLLINDVVEGDKGEQKFQRLSFFILAN